MAELGTLTIFIMGAMIGATVGVAIMGFSLMRTLDGLREENGKLKIDLLHEPKSNLKEAATAIQLKKVNHLIEKGAQISKITTNPMIVTLIYHTTTVDIARSGVVVWEENK